MRWHVTLLAVAILGGCATKYQDMGFTGGVAAEPVMTDVYRIVARGNGYTSSDRIQDFVEMKASETTLAAGSAYFVISRSEGSHKRGCWPDPGCGANQLCRQHCLDQLHAGDNLQCGKAG